MVWITTEVRPRSVGDASKASRFSRTTWTRRLRRCSEIGRVAILRSAKTRWNFHDCSDSVGVVGLLAPVEFDESEETDATGEIVGVW